MQGKKIFQLIVGPIATNCWIYPLSDEKAAVIDPGDEADLIISTLRKLNLCPDFIILTHGHFDHIGAVPSLVDAFSSVSPQIAIHRLDSEYLGPDSYKVHSQSIKAAMGDISFIEKKKKKMPAADLLLEEGGTIGPLTVLHLPGHTPGSAAFWDKEEGVLFTGDTLFEDSWGRTDLPGGNEGQIMASLKRLFKMNPNIKVYPGHGNTTTIGREVSNRLTAL
jgi:glyoxylase-like metal-dependent hydrolase (beta-lactamase superfamily II)